jgi:hypothetical protein
MKVTRLFFLLSLLLLSLPLSSSSRGRFSLEVVASDDFPDPEATGFPLGIGSRSGVFDRSMTVGDDFLGFATKCF